MVTHVFTHVGTHVVTHVGTRVGTHAVFYSRTAVVRGLKRDESRVNAWVLLRDFFFMDVPARRDLVDSAAAA